MSDQVKCGTNRLIKVNRVGAKEVSKSSFDFKKNYKPLFEKLDAWRKESASSQIRVS